MKLLLSYLFVPLTVFCQSDCFEQYYQTNTTHKVNAEVLVKLKSAGKIFIVHTPEGNFGLKDKVVGDSDLKGRPDSLNRRFESYLNPICKRGNLVLSSDAVVVVEEVHLYTRGALIGNKEVILPYNLIERMDVYGIDREATRRSLITGITVITIVLTALVALIIGIVEIVSMIYRKP